MTAVSFADVSLCLPTVIGNLQAVTPNAERLRDAVLRRRAELDISQAELTAAGGPSNSTMTAIENGRMDKLERVTARKLDRGLRWEPGSARAVFEGTGEAHPVREGMDPQAQADLRATILAAAVDEDTKARLLDVLEGKQPSPPKRGTRPA